MRKILHKLDNHLLPFLAGFLLVFIPLYPKLPLYELLPGYIVRLRLEDIFVAITIFVYAVYVLRRKAVFWNTPLTKPILLYLLVGASSVLSGIFIVHSIPFEALHINKALLHYGRRVEYMALFFIFFSTVKSLRKAKIYLAIYLITILGVTIYGYGQKYLYWPAFSTMNREFSKGWRLYLTKHARVMSTFGGHYDLAAFTMVSLAFLWSLVFGARKKLLKAFFVLLLAGSFWLIILTASRVSFISYLVALTIIVFLWMFRRGFSWAASRWFLSVFLSILIMFSFGDLSERFLHLVKLDQRFSGIQRILFSPIGKPPEKAQPIDELTKVTSKSDEPPSLYKPGSKKPADVEENLPDYKNFTTKTGKVIMIPVKRTYSATALRFDLSTGIRLDILWPRAWQGFLKNPLVGSGYSTLTKERPTDFTEAESTDNGYLRALGETGALGVLTFYAIIITVLLRVWWALPGVRDPIIFSFLIGGIGAIIGLLINNIYIDIFEASKVAMPFWSFVGIMLGVVESEKRRISRFRRPFMLKIDIESIYKKIVRFVKSDLFCITLTIIIAFTVRLYRFKEPLADWHSWRQADTSAVTRNFARNGINLLYPTYDDLSSMASGKPNLRGLRMVEFPLYNAVSVIVDKFVTEVNIEQAGRLTSIIASLGSLIFIFLIVKKYINRRVAFLSGLFFAVIPYNIYYSRVVLPEPSMVFSSLGMLYFFDRWMEKKSETGNLRLKIKKIMYYLITLIFSATALLIKPYAVFLFLPLAYLMVRHQGWKSIFMPSNFLFFVLSLIPFITWRWWISHFPEGIPAYTWLLNGDGIRFKGAFFFWIFADRIGRLILGYWGLPILFIGLLIKPSKKVGWFFHVWAFSIVLYLFTFATGNVRHDYYQLIIIPIIAIFLGIGSETILTLSKEFWNKKLSISFWIVSVFFMLGFGWYHVRDFFNINHREIVEAGQEVDKLLKPNALVIAPYNGDTAFLYQTKRAGWPIVEGSIKDLVAQGAQYYVSVNDDKLTQNLIQKSLHGGQSENLPYKILARTPSYTIIQLVLDKDLPK